MQYRPNVLIRNGFIRFGVNLCPKQGGESKREIKIHLYSTSILSRFMSRLDNSIGITMVKRGLWLQAGDLCGGLYGCGSHR